MSSLRPRSPFCCDSPSINVGAFRQSPNPSTLVPHPQTSHRLIAAMKRAVLVGQRPLARHLLASGRCFSASSVTRNSEAALAAVLEAIKLHRPGALEAHGWDGGLAPMRTAVVIDVTWLFHRMLAFHSTRTGASITDYTVQATAPPRRVPITDCLLLTHSRLATLSRRTCSWSPMRSPRFPR